jgi:hypothetical protein
MELHLLCHEARAGSSKAETAAYFLVFSRLSAEISWKFKRLDLFFATGRRMVQRGEQRWI